MLGALSPLTHVCCFVLRLRNKGLRERGLPGRRGAPSRASRVPGCAGRGAADDEVADLRRWSFRKNERRLLLLTCSAVGRDSVHHPFSDRNDAAAHPSLQSNILPRYSACWTQPADSNSDSGLSAAATAFAFSAREGRLGW